MPAGGRLAHQLILEGRVAGFLRGRARECRLPPPRTSTLSEQDQPDLYQNRQLSARQPARSLRPTANTAGRHYVTSDMSRIVTGASLLPARAYPFCNGTASSVRSVRGAQNGVFCDDPRRWLSSATPM